MRLCNYIRMVHISLYRGKRPFRRIHYFVVHPDQLRINTYVAEFICRVGMNKSYIDGETGACDEMLPGDRIDFGSDRPSLFMKWDQVCTQP
ncbi:MAG: hypothetical protein VYB08_08765, partial [Candidatus Latescibacterota bacterium]|nr:hypothetical protein [Candidatus Latescibacterota bacterium]